MAREEDLDNATESQKAVGQKNETNPSSSDDSDSEYDSDYSYSSDDEAYEVEGEDEGLRKSLAYRRAGGELPESENAPKKNLKEFTEALNSKQRKRVLEEWMRKRVYDEDRFNFPEDLEKWTEEDLRELWAAATVELKDPGWDPAFVDEEDLEFVQDELEAGRKPPIAPFYVPYRKPYPAIPNNHYDIKNPKSVIEELDRIEEFLRWVSHVFADGSSFYSLQWRTWGACFIQAAWRRYCKRKIERSLREAEERLQDALANEEGSSTSLGATTIYASRFAANALKTLRQNSERKNTMTQRLLPLLPQKPAEPDFSTQQH